MRYRVRRPPLRTAAAATAARVLLALDVDSPPCIYP
jgi:hypothetical protein